jgi:hypothetical protein
VQYALRAPDPSGGTRARVDRASPGALRRKAADEHQLWRTREVDGYRSQPIVFNEDDHFEFDQPRNNFLAAVREHASWGYFDPGSGAGGAGARGNYVDGYQLVPVNWGINTPRKRAFFDLLREMTGGAS